MSNFTSSLGLEYNTIMRNLAAWKPPSPPVTYVYNNYYQQAAPQPTPVTTTFDPKIEANALYSKPMPLFCGGFARIGASPAPIVGPYINGDIVDFVVSFGVPANVSGDRKIYKIYLDNELAWSSSGGGTVPGDGTFAAETFDFIFKPGTLTQSAVSLESEKFPGDECAYRPQMILQIRNLPWARFQKNSGKPVPYVACDIGDVTDGAVPQNGINLGEALELVAHSPWAGDTKFEAVGLTDVVAAILIKDNFTIVQLCQSITQEYRNLDLLVSDKTRIKDRGATVAPNYIFDRGSIVSGDQPVIVTRGGATAQKREHELLAIDPDQDYTAVPSLSKIPRNPMVISAAVGKDTTTIPVVIDANTRQALATFSQNYEENARRKVVLKVSTSGYGIEPGDLFALTGIADGFDNEVFKCTQTTHGANWIVELEGEAILRCSIYGGPVGGTTWEPATISNVVLSNGDLTARCTLDTSTNQGARVADTAGRTSGKYYFEIQASTIFAAFSTYFGVGIGTTTSTYSGMSAGHGVTGVMIYRNDGNIWSNGAIVGYIGPLSIFTPTVFIAVNLDDRKIWFRNLPTGSSSPGDWNGDVSADPATNVGGVTIPAGVMVPFCTFGGPGGAAGDEWTANFGGSAFVGVVPTGFLSGW